MFKKFLKWLLITIVVLGVVGSIYFFVSNKLFLENSDENYTTYLKNNQITLKANFENTDQELFKGDFYKNNVFLLGEVHGFADVQEMDKSLLIYLNKKMGIRYYIAEMDSITAKDLNLFLSKKVEDTILLKSVVNTIRKRIPQQASQELYNKWLDIYYYNKNLSDSLKITVLGIDKNLDDESTISRDSLMIANFTNIIKSKNLEEEKFYGLFGFFHVLQSSVNNNYQSFAFRLKNSKFNVQSIVCYTIDSDMYLPKELGVPVPDDERIGLANSDGPLVLVKGINDLKEVTKANSITLFDLDSKDSPYLKSQKLIKIKSQVFGGSILPYTQEKNTLDYFQYALLLRNSTSLTPLK